MSWSPETKVLLKKYSANSYYESGKSKVFFTAGPDERVGIFVLDGVVRLSCLSSRNKTDLLRFVWPGEMFNNFYKKNQSSYELKTVGKSQVIILSELQYDKILENNQMLRLEVLHSLSRMKDTSNNLLSFLKANNTSLRVRVAGLFLGLASYEENSLSNYAEVTIPIPYSYFAEILGVDPSVLSRQLAKFESEGLIERTAPRRINILNVQGLRELSPQVCSLH